MIHAVLIFNNAGKPRLTKFYSPSAPQTRANVLQTIYHQISTRDDSLCNFVDFNPGKPFFGPTAGATGAGGTGAGGGGAGAGGEKDGLDAFGEQIPVDEDVRVIYRHYATLYFAMVVDQSESELGILDLIQVFVESLDRCFENVCELDLIFHFDEVHTLLNCLITGGLVLDTSLDSISASFRAQQSAKKASQQGALGGLGGLGGLNLAGGLGGITGGGAGAPEWADRLGLGPLGRRGR